MRRFEPERVGEVLRRIYDAEIPGRLEWMFEEGFVWVLVGPNGDPAQRNFPRLWIDEMLAGGRTVVQSDAASRAHERSQFLMRDWQERGRERTIEEAVCALAEAVTLHYANSEFARWWRQLRGTTAA